MTDYRPVSCEFHDVLEATATRRIAAGIAFLDPQGHLQWRRARIADVVTRAGGEFIQLDTGEEVRLDRIVSVDGVRLADAQGHGR